MRLCKNSKEHSQKMAPPMFKLIKFLHVFTTAIPVLLSWIQTGWFDHKPINQWTNVSDKMSDHVNWCVLTNVSCTKLTCHSTFQNSKTTPWLHRRNQLYVAANKIFWFAYQTQLISFIFASYQTRRRCLWKS